MNTRHTRTSPETFGLEAWLESERILLPLRAVSINADIAAGFASVEVDQLFEQNNTQPLDCRFLFPLPADAAVCRCEMHVNGRVVLAKVEERSVAESMFTEAKNRGRRAALATGERDNLFTLQLGNVQPGDTVLMRFGYIQPVQRLREQRSLRVPVNPGVRYIPGSPLLRPNSGPGTIDDTDAVPDASRISPPRIDSGHADAASLHASVRLRGAGDLADSLSSASHPVVVRREGDDLLAAIAAGGHLPDRDFVLSWEEKLPAAPIVRTWLDRGRRGVLEIRLPAIGAASTQPVDPGDAYFLLDRSGSMQGENWTGACKALAAFMPRLHPDTRVWISLFSNTVADYDAVPVRAGDLDLGPDGENLHRRGPSGGTHLANALRHVGAKLVEHSAQRPASLLLITDGQIGNERQVLEIAKELRCPVHVIGVAMTANDQLDALATATGGRSVFLSPGADIPAAVERFVTVLRPAVLTDVSLPHGWSTADGRQLRDLADGDDLIVPLSATADAPLLCISGRSPDGSDARIDAAESALPAAGMVWARARIRHLDREGAPVQALALAKEFNLLSKDAAFIAWDETEKVSIAQTELIQPALEPARLSAMVTGFAPPEDRGVMCLSSRRSASAQPSSAVGRELRELVRGLEECLQHTYQGRRIPIALREILEELMRLAWSDEALLEAGAEQRCERLFREILGFLEHERRRLQEKLHHLEQGSPQVEFLLEQLRFKLVATAP